jgi:hypothetical protein
MGYAGRVVVGRRPAAGAAFGRRRRRRRGGRGRPARQWNDDGLPIGVRFLDRFGDDAALIRLASQPEASQPRAGRLPAVHAARAAGMSSTPLAAGMPVPAARTQLTCGD